VIPYLSGEAIPFFISPASSPTPKEVCPKEKSCHFEPLGGVVRGMRNLLSSKLMPEGFLLTPLSSVRYP